MKRALPIAAAAILAAVIVYSLLPRASDRVTVNAVKTGLIQNDLAMIKPKLTGTDEDGNPYVITAEIAIRIRKEHPPRQHEEGRSRHDDQ